MLTLKGNELLLYPNNASREGPYRHKGCRLEHPLRAMSLVSWGVERLTRFSLSLYLFRVIWLNVYKVLLCLHCWGITTIRCPSMLAYGLANNNLVCILCSEDGLLYDSQEFCKCSSVDVFVWFLVLKLVWIRIEYSLV